MLGLIVVAAVLAANPPASLAESRTYSEAKAATGRSPADQIKLALWCEAHGLPAERLHHLTLAVLADPKNVAARGLMGMVALDGRWLRPEAVADRVKGRSELREYEARRLDAPGNADGHLALADWADKHGLPDQARAHLVAATRLDPSREDAWKRLGYARHGARWMTDAQVAAEKAEADARKQADQHWKPLLEKYRSMLADPARRDEAEALLAEVVDPRAVPSIGRVFATTTSMQPRAVRLLGQVDSPSSSKALASLAVFAKSDQARRAAAETLRGRDPREFAEPLIALLRSPVRFEVKHVAGPGSPGELLVEGRKVNIRRVYTPPSVLQAGDGLGSDAMGRAVVVRQVGPTPGAVFLGSRIDDGMSRVNGMSRDELLQALPVMEQSVAFRPILPTTRFTFHFSDRAEIPLERIAAEAQKSSAATERQLRADVRLLEDYNVAVRSANDRVSGVLNDSTGQKLPAERPAWVGWWVDRIGYSAPSADWTYRDSVIQDVSIAYQPPAVPDGAARQITGYERRSCFGAGTPVRTVAGPRPIESLRVGDRVLTQDVATGALGYRPILVVHRNPPSATFRIRLKGEAIVASHFHRFWVAGQGWVMARDLKAGDPVRTLDGAAPVESIEADAVQPVFNLDVADDADFFAGLAAALVHDNTPPDPRLVPFDALDRR